MDGGMIGCENTGGENTGVKILRWLIKALATN